MTCTNDMLPVVHSGVYKICYSKLLQVLTVVDRKEHRMINLKDNGE